MLGTLYETDKVHFCLFGTNGFHVKAENEKIIPACLHCCQNLKYENFTSSFGRLRQKLHQRACSTCSTIILTHSTNQIVDLWRCRGRCCRHFLNSQTERTTSPTAGMSFEDINSRYWNHFLIFPSHLACKISFNYPGIKWVWPVW